MHATGLQPCTCEPVCVPSQDGPRIVSLSLSLSLCVCVCVCVCVYRVKTKARPVVVAAAKDDVLCVYPKAVFFKGCVCMCVYACVCLPAGPSPAVVRSTLPGAVERDCTQRMLLRDSAEETPTCAHRPHTKSTQMPSRCGTH